MDEPAVDFDGLRRALEDQVQVPPFQALRRRYRRRQQTRAVAGSLGVTLVVAVATVGIGLGDRSREPASPPDTLAALLTAEDKPVPPDDFGFRPTDVEFVSPTRGWVLGLACQGATCDIRIRRTADGGQSWEPEVPVAVDVPRAGFGSQDATTGAVRSLRFLDERHGFAFNPGLYVTDDGGATWRPRPREAKLHNVAARGGTPWFLSRPCAIETACDYQLATASVAGIEQERLPAPAVGSESMLRRAGARAAWLLTWSKPGVVDEAISSLQRTLDGGRTWQAVTDPCSNRTVVRQMSAADARTLWLVCASHEFDEAAVKDVYVSTDGGRRWRAAGAVPFRGVPTDLVALSPDVAYLTTQEANEPQPRDAGHLLVTRDGGRTWDVAAGTAGPHYGFSNLQFVDATHGWAMGDRGVLWRTADGRTWQRLALPTG